MSISEIEPLMKLVPAQKHYKSVLVLTNYKSLDLIETVTVDYFKEIFYQAFYLTPHNEPTPALLKIQTLCDKYLQGMPEIKLVPRKVLYTLIIEGIRIFLNEELNLEVLEALSADEKDIMFSLTASEEFYIKQAIVDRYLLQMQKQPDEVLDFQEISPYSNLEIHESKTPAKVKDYKDYFKKYDENNKESAKGSYFRSIDKIRLIFQAFQNKCNMGLLIKHGILKSYMPLIEHDTLFDLKLNWGNLYLLYKNPFKSQDLQKLEGYFGSRVSMYFGWIEFTKKFFTPLALISIIFVISFYVSDNSDDSSDNFTLGEASMVIFALIVPIYSTFYEQLWIREQKKLAWRWGTTNLLNSEVPRPWFEGTYGEDPVSGMMKKLNKHPTWTRVKRIISPLLTMALAGVVIAIELGLLFYQSFIDIDSFYYTSIGIINTLQIQIFNIIFNYIARFLNDWENYELPTQYTNALSFKMFCFQFANCYITLFYIAFIKTHTEGCNDGNCIKELSIHLGTIFITSTVLCVIKLLASVFMVKYSIETEKLRIRNLFSEDKEISDQELQWNLNRYDTPLEDYMDIVMAYGYVVMFGASTQLVPVLFLALVLVEIRVDAWTLCNSTQRPYPNRSESIGIWVLMLQLLSMIGVATNVAIFIFTTNAFEIENDSYKWLLFFSIEHVLIFTKLYISEIIPDQPAVVGKGIAWSNRISKERLDKYLLSIKE